MESAVVSYITICHQAPLARKGQMEVCPKWWFKMGIYAAAHHLPGVLLQMADFLRWEHGGRPERARPEPRRRGQEPHLVFSGVSLWEAALGNCTG